MASLPLVHTRWRWTALGPAFMLIIAGVSTGSLRAVDVEPIKVVVSIQPQAYFVERVGGGHVDVRVLVGPGQSHATYEPTPQQMVELQRADVYFSIGVPFEAGLLRKVQGLHDELPMVDMSSDIEGVVRETEPSEHDAGRAHDHRGMDPHLWMDPSKVKVMAQTASRHLSGLRPQLEPEFQTNLQGFLNDLDSLDARIRNRLSGVPEKTFYVFHPAYGHFASAYGLNQVAVEVEGKEPGPAQLVALIEQAKSDAVSVIIVQPQFAQKSAETIAAAIGAKVLMLDPLARDYLANMEHIAEALAAALTSGKDHQK